MNCQHLMPFADLVATEEVRDVAPHSCEYIQVSGVLKSLLKANAPWMDLLSLPPSSLRCLIRLICLVTVEETWPLLPQVHPQVVD